jgi:hypothetical protein
VAACKRCRSPDGVVMTLLHHSVPRNERVDIPQRGISPMLVVSHQRDP